MLFLTGATGGGLEILCQRHRQTDSHGCRGTEHAEPGDVRRSHSSAIVKHGVFTFGLVATAAVIWRRLFGAITVSLTLAVVVLACISGIVSAGVNYATIRSALVRAR